MSEYLHIVCLDAPSPPDYGGAIDMYYKIQALAGTGKKIILHYFSYSPIRNTEGLEQFCTAIYAYERKSIFRSLPLSQPYIVQSRIDNGLIKRLNEDDHPILLEGLHCSGVIPYIKNAGRIVLRMHNEEAAYYHHLAKAESSFLKRKYFLQESKVLAKYQTQLDNQIKLACLSEADIEVLKKTYQFQHTHFVPCFIPWQKLSIKEGKGDYCLYHVNLAVSENEEAALWLIQNVFSKTDVPFFIAGKGVSKRLKNIAGSFKNIRLINQPTITEIDELIRNAHVNVLPSLNSTGIKLKLLNALLNGRHCITNYHGVKGSKIQAGLFIAEEPSAWINLVNDLMKKEFTSVDKEARKEVLTLYDNHNNAQILSALW